MSYVVLNVVLPVAFGWWLAVKTGRDRQRRLDEAMSRARRKV